MACRVPERNEAWTILGRGPSLLSCTQADVLPGSTVVAVNGAIYHHAIQAGWLCGLDEPDSWLSREPDAPDPPWGTNAAPTIITREQPKWRELADRWGAEVWNFPGGNGGNAEISGLIGDRQNTDWARWSMLFAIAWARFGGARRIRLLGVDMGGKTRAYGRGNQITPSRWVKETGSMEKALRMCRGAGVEVERYTPSEVAR